MKTQKLKWAMLFVTALLMTSCAAQRGAVTGLSKDDATKLPAVRVITMVDCTSARLGTAIPIASIGEPVSAVTLNEPVWTDAADGAAAYCSVDGRMDPVDSSDTAQPINFRVVLPASWSMRSVQLGGGGMNGTIPRLTNRSQSPMPGPMMPEGFAAYGSDSGHSMDPEWALNDEAIRNLGYMQLKKTHDAAMVLMERMYGEKPRFNYFIGGSQGGREALTVAQRYPADYDGISSSVPIVNFTTLMLAPYLIHIQQKPLKNWVPANKSNAVAWEFIRQCDDLDGLKDGMINNYAACRAIFNVHDGDDMSDPWRARRCADNIDPDPNDTSINACFSDEQIETLEFIFSSYKFTTPLANGVTSFGMWAPTTEPTFTFSMPSGGPPSGGRPASMAPPGAPPGGMPQGKRPGGMPGTSPRAEGGPSAGMPARMPAGMPDMGLLSRNRYKGQEGASADATEPFVIGSAIGTFLFRDLTANAMDYVEGGETDARRVELSKWLDSTDPDLSAFYKQGGKLIVAMGTSDTMASSGAQLDYYQSVIDTMGQSTVDAFARLYVVPHGSHGLSGKRFSVNADGAPTDNTEIPDKFDRFSILQNWVENGVAPGKSEVVTGKSGSLPLCSYPTYPKYLSGDTSKASSYTCASPW